MIPFKKDETLPSELKRFENTIHQMLQNVHTDGMIFATIDEKFIIPNTFHRKPGLHVDMVWNPELNCHSRPPRHIRDSNTKQAIILASNIGLTGMATGEYHSEVDDIGGYVYNPKDNLEYSLTEPNVVYAGDTMKLLHESTLFQNPVHRTLVRLNVNGWLPS
jgi:hypothetical protein